MGPMASRMSTCLPSRLRERGAEAVADLVHHDPRQIRFGRRAAWPGPDPSRGAASGRMTSLTRASMKFLKNTFFVPFS